jgi:hypothetical protein
MVRRQQLGTSRCRRPKGGMLNMKRLLLASAAVLGLAGPSHAFTNQAATPINQYTHLECVPTYEQPRDHDRNPAYKISVDLQLNGQQVTEIDAQHVLVVAPRSIAMTNTARPAYGKSRVTTSGTGAGRLCGTRG